VEERPVAAAGGGQEEEGAVEKVRVSDDVVFDMSQAERARTLKK